MEKEKRDIFFDIAKGIGIILVVIGHCIPDASTGNISDTFLKSIFRIIYSFHMPLFFFVAGIFTFREHFKEKGLLKVDILKSRFS